MSSTPIPSKRKGNRVFIFVNSHPAAKARAWQERYESTITRSPMAAVVDLNHTGLQDPSTNTVYIATEKNEAVIKMRSSLMFLVIAYSNVLSLKA
jgi:hypothetical protein